VVCCWWARVPALPGDFGRPGPRGAHSTRGEDGCPSWFPRCRAVSDMEITALVIGVLALIMAVPSALQMFFGRPRLRIAFEYSDVDVARRLVCIIRNAPIENAFLKRIVVRDQVAISANFLMRETGNDRVMLDTSRAYLIDFGENQERAKPRPRVILSDYWPAMFTCVVHMRENQYATAMNLETDQTVILPPGRYRVEIIVTGGHAPLSVHREFTIGQRPDTTYWLQT
jgi:hypothetical protein